jgi:hypothetical protein
MGSRVTPACARAMPPSLRRLRLFTVVPLPEEPDLSASSHDESDLDKQAAKAA